MWNIWSLPILQLFVVQRVSCGQSSSVLFLLPLRTYTISFCSGKVQLHFYGNKHRNLARKTQKTSGHTQYSAVFRIFFGHPKCHFFYFLQFILQTGNPKSFLRLYWMFLLFSQFTPQLQILSPSLSQLHWKFFFCAATVYNTAAPSLIRLAILISRGCTKQFLSRVSKLIRAIYLPSVRQQSSIKIFQPNLG